MARNDDSNLNVAPESLGVNTLIYEEMFPRPDAERARLAENVLLEQFKNPANIVFVGDSEGSTARL